MDFSRQSCNNQKFLVTIVSKAFQKIWHTPFPGDQKNSVTIRQWGCSGWWWKKSGHHPTHPTIWWWLKFFGRDDFFFKYDITWPPPFSFWWPKTFNHHLTYPHHRMPTERAGGMCYHFGKKTFIPCFPTLPLGWLKNFGHHLTVGLCWMAIESFWSPFNIPMFDGDQMFLVAQKGMGGKGMK